MLRTLVYVSIVVGAAAVGAAQDHLCSLDSHPGATLLLPYFEIDLDDPTGTTTQFSIHNARSLGTLTQVVLWTDLAVPTFAFNVYLTGFDVQVINLRDIFEGRLPKLVSVSARSAICPSPHMPSRDATTRHLSCPSANCAPHTPGMPTVGGLCSRSRMVMSTCAAMSRSTSFGGAPICCPSTTGTSVSVGSLTTTTCSGATCSNSPRVTKMLVATPWYRSRRAGRPSAPAI